MDILPVADNLCIKPIKRPEKTQSGLYLPDSSDTTTEGVVISKGTGVKDYSMMASIKDTVLYDKNRAVEIKIEDEVYHIIEEKNLFCILKKNNN